LNSCRSRQPLTPGCLKNNKWFPAKKQCTFNEWIRKAYFERLNKRHKNQGFFALKANKKWKFFCKWKIHSFSYLRILFKAFSNFKVLFKNNKNFQDIY